MAARTGRSQTINLGSRLAGPRTDSKSKFGGEGMNFKARFVGSEEVMESSGSKIAQAAIGRIRAACREAGGAKPKVLINLSFSGIKVADLKTKIWSINVPVPRLTYVTKDSDDKCVFCIIVARKKAGFKLFVYKAEERITAQIVQSIRELFQVVYKMVQQKKKMEETKSKSATVLPKSTSDTPIAKMTSDSKLLDPPPQYEERNLDLAYSMIDFPPPHPPSKQGTAKSKVEKPVEKPDEKADPGYSMVDFPPPPAPPPPPRDQATSKPKPQEDTLVDLSNNPTPPVQLRRQESDIYAVPFTKRKSSSNIPFGYQVPISNMPAPPINHYQVPSNRPAFSESTDAAKEWNTLDAELAEIAKELNMFGGNVTSTPEHLGQQQATKPSIVDPFQDIFFDQPFNPREGELNSINQPNSSIVSFESSDPFSSPNLSILSNKVNDVSDDPFVAFEFDGPKTSTANKPRESNTTVGSHKESTVQQPLEGTEEPPPLPPDPHGVRMSLILSPDETEQLSTNPLSLTAGMGAVTDKTDKVINNWTTFDTAFGTSELGSTELTTAKKRSSMFEESFSSKQITDTSSEQMVSPLKPPPRNRRRSSRPHTVYGEKGIKTDSQQPTSNKFDLSYIKPKIQTQDDNTSADPFMDLFKRKNDNDLVDVPSTTDGLEYTSTHL